MYKPISDYGIIGDLHSVALIGLDGSIDWMCLPHIDSPSVFGALLDDEKGGRFLITPTAEYDSVAQYMPGTNILQTRFRTRHGIMQLTDFMPVCSCGREEMENEHELYRRVEVINGRMGVRVVFDPRFDYARSEVEMLNGHERITARGGGESLSLVCSESLPAGDQPGKYDFLLSAGDTVWMHMRYGETQTGGLDVSRAERALADTETYWKTWLYKSETGRMTELGIYKDMVERSALVLKLLYYEPTGTIAAAATTSLPEAVGGPRNWDYRYTWVRDSSFTLQALFNLGHLSETEGYIRWIEGLLSEHGAGRMQIMYGLRGEDELPERELDHLDGYKGSRPVRIGNGAASQKQLDIYGELMDAALKLSDYVGKIDADLWPFLRDVCDYVAGHWRDRDSGIWEVRGGPYEFVYSKVMCWVALDRGLAIARRYGFPADLKKWQGTASEIKEEVLQKGWNEEKRAFVQHYDTDSLDASGLLIPVLGFLPFDDPRVISNMEAVRRELSHKGFLYRYSGNDGLEGDEGTFLLCTFWLIDNLIHTGNAEDAEALLKRVEGVANHLGLFSEEYDVRWRETLGNFPQAFTHIGYINSVIALQRAKRKVTGTGKKEPRRIEILLSSRIVLNDGQPRDDIAPADIAVHLKESMNILRGAFFDSEKGRVAYERMKASDIYGEYLRLSYTLKLMDLDSLTTREQQIAFWVNLYNVIVIHGVIELGIRDSVKELRNIFRRIQYRIGDMYFSPEEIEHGILRGNRKPPNSLFRVFGKSDGRLRYAIGEPDPRIHFAIVCASSSCPPISSYSPEKIDEELDISARTFLNGGGADLDMQQRKISLSRIFKWYADDFGASQNEILNFIAPFLYNESERNYLKKNADILKVEYQDYDWRLNRY